jgi:DNA-binding NtrC family response regulator
MDILCRRDYPGNIRELSQIVENAVLLTDSDLIYPQHLGATPLPSSHSTRRLCTLKENDDAHVAYVLSHTPGDRKEAARVLGITVRQLQRITARMRHDPRWAGMLH